MRETHGEVVVFLDGDVTNPRPETAASLVDALIVDPSLMMVRAAYERPFGGQPGEGGRVTELTARPALTLLFPTLAHLRQPLAGEVAMRRSAIESSPLRRRLRRRRRAAARHRGALRRRRDRRGQHRQPRAPQPPAARTHADGGRGAARDPAPRRRATVGPVPHERPPLATERSFLARRPKPVRGSPRT